MCTHIQKYQAQNRQVQLSHPLCILFIHLFRGNRLFCFVFRKPKLPELDFEIWRKKIHAIWCFPFPSFKVEFLMSENLCYYSIYITDLFFWYSIIGFYKKNKHGPLIPNYDFLWVWAIIHSVFSVHFRILLRVVLICNFDNQLKT